MLLPRGVLVPDIKVFVGEENVGFLIAVHISDGNPVADLDFCIDRDVAECGSGGGSVEINAAGQRDEEKAKRRAHRWIVFRGLKAGDDWSAMSEIRAGRRGFPGPA